MELAGSSQTLPAEVVADEGQWIETWRRSNKHDASGETSTGETGDHEAKLSPFSLCQEDGRIHATVLACLPY